MKHIAFAKIGKSTKFASAFSPIGGDSESPNVFKALANNNPDITFYMIGRSDMGRLSDEQLTKMFPYNNVVDIWKEAPFKTFKGDGKNYNDPFYHYVGNYFKDRGIKVDGCVMMVGQVGTVTIPGMIEQVRDRSLIASVIDMTKNYTTPIAVWLNDYKVPYLEIVNDPRYVMNQSRDIFHLPFKSIGQFNWEYEVSPIKSYEDQDRQDPPLKMKSTYDGMETAFLIGRDKPNDIGKDRSINFGVVLNEGSPSRYPLLKEWVLDVFEDVAIYGKWDHEDAQPEVDCRFKGSKNIEDIQKIMQNTKYTMIIPIRDGWVTSKYIEMIHAGVIPFFHPSYDKQKHIDIPDILRPDTPEQMLKNIELIELNGVREALLKNIRDIVLKNEYYDGTFMSEKILKNFDPKYALPDLSKYAKTEVVSLDDFF